MIAPYALPAKRGNRLLERISVRPDERHILEMGLSRTRLAAGASIFDGEIDRVLFIETGIVSPTVITSDGKSLGMTPIGREGAVGLLEMGAFPYGLHSRALTAVEALQISARALRPACSESGELESLLRNYSEALLRDSIRALPCHYNHDLERRLPQWLLIATERMGSNRLDITQEILAEAHGVTRSAISLTLEALEARGLIERARGQIYVINRNKPLNFHVKRRTDKAPAGATICGSTQDTNPPIE